MVLDEAVELAKRFGEADSPAVRERRARRDPPARLSAAAGTRGEAVAKGDEEEMSDELEQPQRAARSGLAGRVGAAAGEGARPSRRWGSTSTRRASSAPHARRRSSRPTASRRSRSSSGWRLDVRVAGRVLTKRGHGKASFATLRDGEARLQVYVRADEVGEHGLPGARARGPGRLRGRRRPRDAHAQGRAERAGDASSSSSRRRCCRRPRSGTGSPTSRSATAGATST